MRPYKHQQLSQAQTWEQTIKRGKKYREREKPYCPIQDCGGTEKLLPSTTRTQPQ